MTGAIWLVGISKKRENAPHCPEREHESGNAQEILACLHTTIHRKSGERVIIAAQIGKVFDHEHGGRHKDEACAREKALEGCDRFGIGYHDEDHHKVSKSFGPPPESYTGKIRPEHAEKAKGKIN